MALIGVSLVVAYLAYLLAIRKFPHFIISHSPIPKDVIYSFSKNSEKHGPQLQSLYRARIRGSPHVFEPILMDLAVTSDEDALRIASVIGLAETNLPKSNSVLLSLISDTNNNISRTAIWSLPDFMSPESTRDALRPLLSSHDPKVARTVIKVLERLPVDCERELLIIVKNSTDQELLVSAISSLKIHGGSETIRYLNDLLKYPQSAIVTRTAKLTMDAISLRSNDDISH